MHCVLQTVLFAVQTTTFMYTSTTVISSVVCHMS